jgi:Tfp pilus assembly protein PilF
LRKALDFYYSYGKANLLLAKIYLKQGENEKARKEAQTAIESGLPPGLLDQARQILKVDDK